MNDATRETWVLTVTSGGRWVATVRIEGCDEETADIACRALLRVYSRERGLSVMVEPRRTIAEHQTLTAAARDLVYAWRGTDPMSTEAEVRQAIEAADSDGEVAYAVDTLLPYVVDACLAAGLLVGGDEVQRVGLQTARDSASERTGVTS